MLFEQFMPHSDILKRTLLRNIINEDCKLCIFEVCGDQTAISLLPSRIPHLQTVALAVLGDILHIKIDADCCLNEPVLTL